MLSDLSTPGGGEFTHFSFFHTRNRLLFACERASSVNVFDSITRSSPVLVSITVPPRKAVPKTGTRRTQPNLPAIQDPPIVEEKEHGFAFVQDIFTVLTISNIHADG